MTPDRELFFIWPAHRAQIIEKHEFYVKQATTRYLTPFTDASISAEADQVESDAVDRMSAAFHPDTHDEAVIYEDSFHEGVWRYQLLTELRDDMRLNVMAGFYYQWEKTLRQWLVDNLRHWHRGKILETKIWKENFWNIFDLLECFGWALRSQPYFKHLDACRLVVNVHKHGDGNSLDDLSKKYPQYLQHPLKSMTGSVSSNLMKLNHGHLSSTDADVEKMSKAINEFWNDLPDRLIFGKSTLLPPWFEKAILADKKAVTP